MNNLKSSAEFINFYRFSYNVKELEKKVRVIMDMGFDRDAAKKALVATKGDVEAALNSMFT
jgi:hypothetical protein